MAQDKHIDLRVQKTEQALLSALDTLLRDRPFEAITVSDLCDKAMVRRATFYKHFGDKYQFLSHCMHRWESLLAPIGTEAGSLDPLEGFSALLKGMLHHLSENQAIMSGAFGCLPGAGMPSFIAEPMGRAIQEKARQFSESGAALPAPPEVVSAFLCGAMVGIAKWWQASTTPLTEDQVVEDVRAILTCIFTPPNSTPQKEGSDE